MANQRSAVWSYGFSSTSSGDMYSGVPCIHKQYWNSTIAKQTCNIKVKN